MVQVQVGNTLKRSTFNFYHTTTVRQILEEKYSEVTGENFGSGIIQLDGAPLNAGEINKTLADFGLDGSEGRNKCMIVCVVKADNA